MKPRCSRKRCLFPPRYLVDTNRPPYAGPQLYCEDHAHAFLKGMRHGQGVHISAIKEPQP